MWRIRWYLCKQSEKTFISENSFKKFRQKTHEMPSRDWFYRFISEDNHIRNQAFWENRDCTVGTIMELTSQARELRTKPQSSRKSAEFKYLLTYLFGDVPLDKMEQEAIKFTSYLNKDLVEIRYIKVIFSYIEENFYHQNWDYTNERARIDKTIRKCQDMFQIILNCIQNPEIRYTLSLVPSTLSQPAASGHSTANSYMSIDNMIQDD